MAFDGTEADLFGIFGMPAAGWSEEVKSDRAEVSECSWFVDWGLAGGEDDNLLICIRNTDSGSEGYRAMGGLDFAAISSSEQRDTEIFEG